MKFKKIIAAASVLASFALVVSAASAHVVVSPKEVGIGKFQTFSVGVPVEKDMPTIGLRLLIPEGLNYVTPNVKPGWKIAVKKEPVLKDGKQVMSEDGDEKVERTSEITWTGGTIPAGQRDDFLFSAQVPAEVTTLNWKAYQTYADGSVVAWDADPKAVADQKKTMEEQMKKDPNMKMTDPKLSPYSQTKVVDDLAAATTATTVTDTAEKDVKTATRNSRVALIVSVVSLIFAAAGLRKKS